MLFDEEVFKENMEWFMSQKPVPFEEDRVLDFNTYVSAKHVLLEISG